MSTPYCAERHPFGLSRHQDFGSRSSPPFSVYRGFLSRRANPIGNWDDFLSQMNHFRSRSEDFLFHHRYFLSPKANPIGNLYGFLSRKEDFLSHHRYFLSREGNPIGNLYSFLSQQEDFLNPATRTIVMSVFTNYAVWASAQPSLYSAIILLTC